MSNDFCPCLSGGQCRFSKEDFARKLETRELRVARRIHLETISVIILDIFWPERFGAVARHNRKLKAELKKLAEQNGFDHVRSDGILERGVGLDDYVAQKFVFFQERPA